MLANQINTFINYCNNFYGVEGIYPLYKGDQRLQRLEIRQAVEAYIYKLMTREEGWMTWGDGDSLDRERVRGILEEMGYFEK